MVANHVPKGTSNIKPIFFMLMWYQCYGVVLMWLLLTCHGNITVSVGAASTSPIVCYVSGEL